MPLYEYKCNQCGSVFERIQKFSDEPLLTHDNCGGAVERLVSAPALQFKGSGWYITDYAKSGSNKPASSGGKAPASEGGSGKSDSSSSSGSSDSGSSSTPAASSKSSSSDSSSSGSKPS
jgi:putative FmdB family regulatory protein